MAIPARTRRILAQILSSESLEHIQTEAAKAAHRLGRHDHVIRFFHDPRSPMSWLMAQALLQLQLAYDVTIIGHTLLPRKLNDASMIADHGPQGVAEAGLVAAWFGLKAPERAPYRAEIETVAAELLAKEGSNEWLESAVNLGLATFCSTSVPETFQDLSGVARNHVLLQQLGHRRGGTIFLNGMWFEEVDGVLRVQEHLEKLGAIGAPLLRTHAEAMPSLPERELRFWFRLSDPYCYLAFKQLDAMSVRHQLDVKLLPAESLLENDELSIRRQATAMMEVGREARRLHIPFGKAPGAEPTADLKLWEVFYGLSNDPEAQRQLVHNAFYALWVKGTNLNDLGAQLALAASVGVSESKATKWMLNHEASALIHENTQDLLDRSGRHHLPTTQLGDRLFVGHQRFELIDALFSERSKRR